jgi:hypothetical protein
VQHIYEAAVRGIPGLEAVAIADDFTITGPALSVAQALQQLVEACKDDGPILNFGKCKALWAYSTNHPSYEPFCDAMSSYSEPIPIFYDAIPLLGAGVGLGNSRARFCNDAIQQHSNFFAAITHPDMPVQAAMLLLRVSGIPRLTYLTRVIPPAIIREACENFDAMIMRTVADKCHLPDPATNTNVRRHITLPLSVCWDGILTTYTIFTCGLLQFHGSISSHHHESQHAWRNGTAAARHRHRLSLG